MPFFQNPFAEEFEGSWPLGDRKHAPTYVIKPNAGRGSEVIYSWNRSPYDLSGNDSEGDAKRYLNILYCLHNPKNWATLQIDLSASAAVTIEDVLASLNANVIFKERFMAEIGSYNDNTYKTIKIRSKKPATEFKFYVQNGQAESVIGFNARAGVAELPTFMSRHTVANRFTYPDSEGKIIELDASNTIDAAIINNAVDYKGVSLGYSSSTVRADWQLLRGRSGLFTFRKQTVDGSNRITQIIEYPAGALAGDMAKKIEYVYVSANTSPSEITEIPYTLETGDLLTP
jgi:hypothetical protein